MLDHGYLFIMFPKTTNSQTIIETLRNLITIFGTQGSIRLKVLPFAIVNKQNKYIECKKPANLASTNCFRAGIGKGTKQKNFRKITIVCSMSIENLISQHRIEYIHFWKRSISYEELELWLKKMSLYNFNYWCILLDEKLKRNEIL